MSKVVFNTINPYTTLSEQLNGTYIQMLIDCVKDNISKDYDGIIVTHGTDTLQYSAATLGFALGNSEIPVVLVSSNYILDDPRMNGLDNFAYAVRFICEKNGKGVFVSYKNKSEGVTIHRATRLDFHASYDDCVVSIGNSFYGRYEEEKFVKNPHFSEEKDETECLEKSFEGDKSRVLWITPYPGIDWSGFLTHCEAASKSDCPNTCKVILLNTFHSGTLNTENSDWKTLMEKAANVGIRVFVAGATPKIAYDSSREFENYNINILPVSSPISAYIKLSMAIASGRDIDDIMGKSLGGDLMR